MGRRARPKDLGADLDTLAPELRWREWPGRGRDVRLEGTGLTRGPRHAGPQCNLDLVIEDIRAELRGRPYDLVAVAGGWHLRTRKQFAAAIHLAMGDRASSHCRARRTWSSPPSRIFSRSPAASSRNCSARRSAAM
jgi:hypothetical protein